MKSAMPYHGVPTPLLRQVCNMVFADVQFAMKLYDELVVTGAWWDYVDDIASHRIGPILREFPAAMRRKILSWRTSNNLWK